MQQIPVIVVLGHVDHGKTTLLDAIRNTSVQKSEPSGITQNIYISEITYKNKPLTFVDTPGHEVFGLMRVQGGRVADMAILIVAADEGVKPQTKESLEIIKKQDLKYIVVITKTDVQGANVEKVKTELVTNGVYLEGMGGDIPYVEVSAVKRTNIDKLMDTLLLYLEVENIPDPDIIKIKMEEYVQDKTLLNAADGYGIVLDSAVDPYLGKMLFGVWKLGTIQSKDNIVVGNKVIRLGRLLDANKNPIKQIQPGKAFIATGLDILPLSGDLMLKVNTPKQISKYLERRLAQEKAMSTTNKVDDAFLDELFEQAEQEQKQLIPLFIKTDVEASKRSVVPTIEKFNTENIEFKVVQSGVGDVTDADIDIAHTFRAIVLGFRVKAQKRVLEYAKRKGVQVHTFPTVYQMYEFLENLIKQAQEKGNGPQIIGKAKVLKVFTLSDGSVVAGSRVIEGQIKRKGFVRVIRDNSTLATYEVQDLKILKEQVNTVEKGKECGINLGKNVDIQQDDVLEFYTEKVE